MDSHKVSVLPEHLKVVELGRRRRWSEDEKHRIVMESLVEPGNVSATARRHGISRSLLTVWRRAHKGHCLSFYIRFGDRGRRVPLASLARAPAADRAEMHPRW